MQTYHVDNGRIVEKEFVDEVIERNQVTSFCGVGAHNQNGTSEQNIGEITTRARTMLLHVKIFCPETTTHMLWPFEISASINLENTLNLDENWRSPLQKLTSTDVLPTLRGYHNWGCPLHVLESNVQTLPKGLPKWKPSVRTYIYLCHSTAHTGNVALVLHPSSGHVSLQFHIF